MVPSSSSPTLIAQAESVFESYLAARLVRARRELTSAKVALLRDSHDRGKREALRRAEMEVEQLQSQLVAQSRKTAQARARVAPPALPPIETSSPSVTPAVVPVLVTVMPLPISPTVASTRGTQPDDRQCPRCNRRVRGSTSCSCGYEFQRDATHLPAQFLSEEELLALRGKSRK
ncbi:MAG: hypothetical protein HY308_02105 [Gammaproteobacteria bacterium]|nr:hypothetical protein [Gammaproteobacteria bacterium]